MHFLRHITPVALMCVIGCGYTGSSSQTSTSIQAVRQADQSKIDVVSIKTLHESFLDQENPTKYAGEIVQIIGKVVSFALTAENQYTVTIRDGNTDAICVFGASLSNQLGEDRPIRYGVTVVIQGQCYASGLFSTNPFTLDGCQIVAN
jgi:hypothetical protein